MRALVFRKQTLDSPIWEILRGEEVWRLVHTSIFGKNPQKGMKLSLEPEAWDREAWNQWFDAEEYKRAKRYALWYLSRKSTHSHFLKKKLLDLLVQAKTVEKIIAELLQLGYLDDDAWLSHYIGKQQKRFGSRLIAYKLKSKGLPQETVEHFFSHAPDSKEESEQEALFQLLQTKYRKKNLSDYKTRRSLIASLLRKGFRLDDIQAALQRSRI